MNRYRLHKLQREEELRKSRISHQIRQITLSYIWIWLLAMFLLYMRIVIDDQTSYIMIDWLFNEREAINGFKQLLILFSTGLISVAYIRYEILLIKLRKWKREAIENFRIDNNLDSLEKELKEHIIENNIQQITEEYIKKLFGSEYSLELFHRGRDIIKLLPKCNFCNAILPKGQDYCHLCLTGYKSLEEKVVRAI